MAALWVCHTFTMRAGLERFRAAVAEPVRLDEAALLLGHWQMPVDVEAGLSTLDAWAERVEASGAPTWERLRSVLFGTGGFSGAASYQDPHASFLTSVLRERVGLPISLGVITLEVARRLGLAAFGISFPGHFLVGMGDPSAPTILDPYHGGTILTHDDLVELLGRMDPTRGWDPSLVAPATSRQILQRMLHNLAGVYGRGDDLMRSLAVLEHLSVLLPDQPRIAVQLARLRERAELVN